MDFTLDAEQQALSDAVGGLIRGVYESSETRRDATKTESGYTAWSKLAAMGVLGLPFEASAIEVSLTAEELGKVIAPDPFVEAVVLAGGLISTLGSDDQQAEHLEPLAAGELLPIVAWLEAGSRWEVGSTETRFDGSTISGTKISVVHGARADVLLVSAALPEGGMGLFLVREGYTSDEVAGADGSRYATVAFENAPATMLGAGGDATTDFEKALDLARIAYAHEALGAMQTALDTTVDYLKTRKQFGVTLNKFQALTFRAADLYVALELARSTIQWATMVAADESTSDAELATAASHAALEVSQAGRLIGKEAIQLHGGIGMTAEYSVGHHTARLIAIEHLIGDRDFHLARLASTVGDHGVFDPIG